MTVTMCFVLHLTENRFYIFSQSISASTQSFLNIMGLTRALKKFTSMLSKRCINFAGKMGTMQSLGLPVDVLVLFTSLEPLGLLYFTIPLTPLDNNEC